ncbi:MAG: lipoprotein insertase outer membrane protein LolB [Gammaproteobacteria bacterium]|nr:lipoprotein insertase outer membrane protein LolB [Gammaproteobacteria bacterium]
MKLLLCRSKWLFINVFFLFTGAGCASLPAEGPAQDGFDLRGKLGIVQADESFSARFLWRQQAAAFRIDLWGPLGQGRLQLAGDQHTLELRDSDGSVISSGPSEAVMNRHLGWSLPLAVLPHWVRGRPAPNGSVAGRVKDAAGRLTAFRQLGWQVELERYQRLSDAAGDDQPVYLPHRVTARRGEYRVRLAISEWQI